MSFLTDVAAFNDEVLHEFGRTVVVHRPADAATPMASPIGSTLVYFYRDPKGHGNADWLAMIREEDAQPGDYLVADDEVYIYGRRSFLLPAQTMRCNHRIALLRTPTPVQAVGVQPYGGRCITDSTAVLGAVSDAGALVTGWPASILIGGRQGAGAHLPLSTPNGGFEMMLPKTIPITLQASDLFVDDLGRRFLADTCEFSELGWRVTVKEMHP